MPKWALCQESSAALEFEHLPDRRARGHVICTGAVRKHDFPGKDAFNLQAFKGRIQAGPLLWGLQIAQSRSSSYALGLNARTAYMLELPSSWEVVALPQEWGRVE